MTEASALYTLARRVGGNIGYALAATLVARGVQVHRSVMVSHVSPLDPAYAEFNRAVSFYLGQAGLDPAAVPGVSLGLINGMVNRQAAMMAYNDVSMVFGLLFVITIPMILLLPSRATLMASMGTAIMKPK